MQCNKPVTGVGACRKALALVSLLVFASAPSARAATPEPLPPPPELLDGVGGPAFNIQSGQGQYLPPYAGGQGYSPMPGQQYPQQPQPYPQPSQPGRPGNDVYDPYNAPVSSFLPPLPGQAASEVGDPYLTPSPFQIPNLNAPPLANLPPNQSQNPNRPPMVISPPASNMPDEYFNLPFSLSETGGIPGVMLPELDEEFYDPGMGVTTKRPIRIGMSSRQLEPFFDLAKGYEKGALDARAQNDFVRYDSDLKKAIDGYMEIIAMADASHEAREEAWYGVARCEYRRENWWKAFDAVERSFPSRFDKAEVEGRIKLEMFIAERLWRLGRNIAPDARKDGANLTGYQAASRVYAAAIFNQPNAKDAPLALLRRGDAAAMDGDWKEAAKFYRTVVQYYPESEPAMQARSSLAESVYRQDWPAGFPEAARQDLASVMTEVESTDEQLSGPAEERRQRAVTMANSHEAELKLRQAKDYMTKIRVRKSRDAAVFQLGEIVSHYPNTPQAREAADLLMEMGIQPPLVLSDGTRYPLPSSGASMLERVANQTGQGGGSAQVDRQFDRRSDVADVRQLPQQPPMQQQLPPQPPMQQQPQMQQQQPQQMGPSPQMAQQQQQQQVQQLPPPQSMMDFSPERMAQQPRQGNFSPAPELAQTPPPQAWPQPRIAMPPRPGYVGGQQGYMPPQQGGFAPPIGGGMPNAGGFAPLPQQNPYGGQYGQFPQPGGFAPPGQVYQGQPYMQGNQGYYLMNPPALHPSVPLPGTGVPQGYGDPRFGYPQQGGFPGWQ